MRLNIYKVLFLVQLLLAVNILAADKNGIYELKAKDLGIRLTDPGISIDSVVKNSREDKWMTLDNPPGAFDYIHKNNLWIKIKIPDKRWNDFSFCMHSYLNGFEVYRDGKVIYKYGNLADSSNFEYYKWHVFSVDTSKKSEYLIIRIPLKTISFLGSVVVKYFGEKAALEELVIQHLKDFYKESIKEVILGIILLFISFVSFLIFFLRIKLKDNSFLYFALLTFLGGITYFDDTPPVMLNNLPPMVYMTIELASTYLLPVVIILFVGKLFGAGWKRILYKLCYIHIVILIVAFSLMSVQIVTEIPFFFYVGFVFIDLILMFYIIYKSRTNTVYKVKPILFGFILFGLFCIQDLLVLTGIISTDVILFGWGLLGLVFTFGYILIKHYMDTYHLVNVYSNEIEEQKNQLDKLQQENLLSQFEALKSQVNPHFLFNTFSTLIAVIEENPDSAANFVQQLSNVYRYVLQSKDSQSVELKNELEFLESYNFLLSKRFGNNFILEICIEQEYLEKQIPPLTLQLLVENAIKHNIISSKKPLKVEILVEGNDYVCVRNNLQKKNIVESSMKIGLQNIINRYKYLCEKNVEVISNHSFFIVRVPLLNKKEK
jgi:sensor histidine kinase YesM